jgi:hypothetical protein
VLNIYIYIYNVAGLKPKEVGPRLHPLENRSERRIREKTDLLTFLFYSPLLSFSSHSGFFCCFVGVIRLDQQLWPLRYASVFLPPCTAVHLLIGRCYCLLIVFLLWIRVFFFVDLHSWTIYEMNISQVWKIISHGLDISHSSMITIYNWLRNKIMKSSTNNSERRRHTFGCKLR